MNPKDEIIKAYAHDYRDMAMDEVELGVMLMRCNNEIIEKLIADIPDEATIQEVDKSPMFGVVFKQQLRDKWL